MMKGIHLLYIWGCIFLFINILPIFYRNDYTTILFIATYFSALPLVYIYSYILKREEKLKWLSTEE